MKKLGFIVMPLLVISFLTCCGGDKPGPEPTSDPAIIMQVKIDESLEDKEILFTGKVTDTITVDWGDGTVDSNKSHTYAKDGTYTIKIDGQLQSFAFIRDNCKNSLNSIYIGNTLSLSDHAFSGCYNLREVKTSDKTKLEHIGSNAFAYCQLNSITIPDSITSIGTGAFNDCDLASSLHEKDGILYLGNDIHPYLVAIKPDNYVEQTSYKIDDNCKIIYNHIFENCSTLTSITIPDSVVEIGDNAFSGCSLTPTLTENNINYLGSNTNPYFIAMSVTSKHETSYVINESTKHIYSEAFKECWNFASIAIPDGVISIGNSAFEDCFSLTSIKIPDSVCSLSNGSFSNCASLGKVEFGENSKIREINEEVFHFCAVLDDVTLPDSITTIGKNAFSISDCLASITIPRNVNIIGYGAFERCEQLAEVIYEDESSIEVIDMYAFSGTSLTSINISRNVVYIGQNICSSFNLDSITVDKENKYYDSRNNCNSIICTVDHGSWSKGYLILGCNNSAIPDGVKATDCDAFMRCTGLTSINIPSSLTYLAGSTFMGCNGLEKVTFDKNSQINSIHSHAFQNCSSLPEISIPGSTTSIDSLAFYGCSKLSIVDLTIFTDSSKIPSVVSDSFEYCSSDIKFYVASGMVDDFLNADKGWDAYEEKITDDPIPT